MAHLTVRARQLDCSISHSPPWRTRTSGLPLFLPTSGLLLVVWSLCLGFALWPLLAPLISHKAGWEPRTLEVPGQHRRGLSRCTEELPGPRRVGPESLEKTLLYPCLPISQQLSPWAGSSQEACGWPARVPCRGLVPSEACGRSQFQQERGTGDCQVPRAGGSWMEVAVLTLACLRPVEQLRKPAQRGQLVLSSPGSPSHLQAPLLPQKWAGDRPSPPGDRRQFMGRGLNLKVLESQVGFKSR